MNKEKKGHSGGLLNDTDWNMLYAGLPLYYAHVVSLYERHKAYSYVAEFARLSLQFIGSGSRKTAAYADIDVEAVRTEMQSRLFHAATVTSDFATAHATLAAMRDSALQRACLQRLVQRMCEGPHCAELAALPFPGPLAAAVDDALAQRCRDAVDVVTGSPPYHQLLYAWRIRRNDYRGAAAVLLDRIRKLRALGEGDRSLAVGGGGGGGDSGTGAHDANGGGGADSGAEGGDVLDTPITRQFLMLINVLSCVEEKQAWIVTEEWGGGGFGGDDDYEDDEGHGNGSNGYSHSNSNGDGDPPAAGIKRQQQQQQQRRRRKVVTLADVRREYQAELDRVAAIQNNQFGFAAGDEMEIL